MKTIEEKAREYTDSTDTRVFGCEETLDATELIQKGYIAGATEALAGQWRKYPDEDFPDSGSEYIVLTESGDLCAVNKYAKKKEVKQYTNIIAWMPIPEPPKSK